jgi:AcrR family transcriptional regulator
MATKPERIALDAVPLRRMAQLQTRRLLLDAAGALLCSGAIPSVAEVALRSGVSRATAYRYFPTRSKLISAVVVDSLGPVRILGSTNPDGRKRIKEVFKQTFPRLRQFEPQLRAALQLSLEHSALERAGKLTEEPYRRGNRIEILTAAAAPLRSRLGKRGFDRLIRALSVIYGIEAYVVLRDIWGAGDREIESIAHWVARALVDAALADADGRATPARPRRRE